MVIRRFELLEGSSPPPCPDRPLRECTPLFLGSYAYPGDPSAVGLDFEDIEYQSALGPAGAWRVPGHDPDRWALHIHGWTAHRREALRLLRPFSDMGFGSFVIDYRNDEGAPRDPSGRHRFGVTEWEDVEAAVRHVIDSGASKIVLVGYSTGAAHAMSFLERSQLNQSVIGAVFDSPNIILKDTTRLGSQGARFPVFGLPVTRAVAEIGMWISHLRDDVDWVATDYVSRAKETLRVPTLVFHGTDDRRVPISTSRRLAEEAPALVTLVETPDAGHVMSWNADRDGYEVTLRRWLSELDQN